MNLEELKIKVSLDLKDLNKQLNGISTSINKTFTSSVKKMSKTTTKEVNIMAKDINKSLNKAFTLDSRKFDADVNRTMNQAKRTVRSACKEIRTEINKAFNINGHIRITASSNSKMTNSGSNSNNTAIAASSQYTGAMIIKATNAIISALTSNNNANTQQTISAIDRATNRIIKALNTTPKATQATSSTNQSTTNKSKTTPNNSNTTTQGPGSYGSNSMQGGTVNWRAGKKQSTTTSFEGEIVNPVVPTIPVEPFKQIQDIIEVINFEVKDFETGLVKASNRAKSVSEELKRLESGPLTGEVIDPESIESEIKGIKQKEIIIPASFKVIDDELQQEINDAVSKIKIPKLLDSKDFKNLGGILDTSLVEAMKHAHEKAKQIRKEIEEMRKKASIPLLNAPQPQSEPQRPEGYNGVTLEPIDFSSMEDSTKKLNELKEQISKIGEQLSSIIEEISNYSINPTMFEETFGSIKEYGVLLYNLYEELERLNKERVKLNIDTSDAEAKIKDFKAIVASYLESIGDGRLRTFSNSDSNAGAGSGKNPPPRPGSKNSKKGGNGNPTVLGFGFGAYKNELEMLGNLAKKVGSKIKNAIKVAFDATQGPRKLNDALLTIEVKALRVFRAIKAKATPIFQKIATPLKNAFNKVSVPIKNVANKITTSFRKAMSNASGLVKGYSRVIKNHLNLAFMGIKSTKLYSAIAPALTRAKGLVSRFANSVRPLLNKAFRNINLSGISTSISRGLSKAKLALSRFASSSKSLWARITGVFRKGALNCKKAMSPLSSIKSLLLSFGSMFGLYQLGYIFVDGTKQAMKYEAALMTIKKTLGGASQSLIDFANTNAQAFGISKSQVMEFGNIYSVIVSNFEKDATKVADTTQKLIESAGIIAGATGYNVNDVLENLRSGILGSSEAVDQLGLNLKVASLEASKSFKEIAKGKKSWEDLTEAQKQAVIAQEIINQTTAKYGGIVKNTASMHNAFMAQVNNTKLALGQLGKALYTAVLPALTTIMAVLEKVFTYAAQVVTNILSLFGITVDFSSSLQGTGDTNIGDSVGDSFENATDSIEGAEEAVEKFKGSLAGFDEINTLSDNTDKNSDSGSDSSTGDIGGGITAPELGETESALDKISDKMKAFLDEVLEPFKNAWDSLGDRWKTAWADLIDSFKNFCDSLARFLKSVWDNGGKEFVEHMAEIALAVGIAAMEIGGTILDALAKLWDHLDPDKNMHTKRLLDILNEVSQKFRDFILGLNEHFENLLKYGGQDVLNALGDCFMDLAAAFVNTCGVIIDAVDGLIDHLDPKFNVDTRNMLQATADMFHAVGEAAWDFSELLKSTLANGGQDVINAFGTCVVNLGETTARVITTMMKSLSAFFDYVDPENNDITKRMMKSWEEAFYAIGDAALEFANLFESVMKNGGQEVLNSLGDAFNSLLGLVGDVVKEIADALNGLFEHLNPKTNQFTQDMLKAWENAFKGITDMADSLGELISSSMDNGGQEILNSIGDLGMKLGEAFGVIVEECAKTFSELFEHMNPENNEHSKKMLTSLNGFADSITSFVDACVKAFQNFMDNGGREVVKNIGDIVAIIIDLAAELGSGIVDLITAFINSWVGQTLIEGVAKALEWVTDKLVALSDVIDVVKDIFKNLIDAIVGVLEGDGEKVGRAFAELIKNAFKLTGEILKWLADVAVDLVEGLVKGICALPKLLWEAVKFLFDTIIGFFKELFGIHSPSTVFADLGKDIVQGLINGITGMVSKATKAISDLGKAILEGAKTIVKDTIAKFKEIKDGVTEKLKETKENVSQKWKEMKENASDYCSQLVEVSRDKFSSVKDKLTKVLEDTNKSVSTKWEDIKKTTTEKCKNIYDDVKTKYTDTKNTIGEILGKTKEEASTKWDAVKTTTIDIISKMKDNASSNYDKLRENLGNTVTKWSENSRKTWETIKENTSTITSNLKDNASKTYEELQTKVSDTLNKWSETSKNTWDTIKENTSTTVSNLKDSVSENYEKIKTNVSDSIEKTKENVSKTWDNVKTTTEEKIKQITETASNSYNTMKETIGSKLEEVKSKTATKWSEMNTDAQTKVSDIVKNAGTKFGEIKNSFTQKLTDAKSAMSSKWNDLKTQGYDSAKGIVDKAKSGLSNIGQTMADAISSGKSKVSSALDKIGDLFKNAKWELPKIKLPTIKVTGEWSFNPPKVPKFSIQWNKRGGIIDGITPLGFANGALQMGGEAGKEMVVPLENTSFTSKIAQAMGQAVDNAMRRSYNNTNNNNSGVNDNRDVVLKIDGREFARTSINQINKLQRESGKTLLDV